MHINLENWYKAEIDRKKLKDLSKRKNLPGLIHFFFYFLFLFIFGYLAYITWGTWWSALFFFIYGTIYAFSVANWHETLHRTAFKTRWLNEVFYHISSFMCDFEGFRWRWSHTFHHTYTMQTKSEYDYEIQVSRPTELLWFFLNYIPFTDLLYPHRLIKYEVLKHTFGKLTPVVNLSTPENQKKKIKQDKPKEFNCVGSIGISGQMHGATVLDRYNNILHPCILWNDTRSMKQCVEMEKNYPQLQEESGNIAMPGFTAPKILWLKENKKEVFDKIYKILLPKDYLRFKLSGSYFSDMSDASGTLWLDVKQRKWSDALLNLTDLTTENMPELVEGSEPTPCVENTLAKEIGFNNKVIIAGGAGDQAAGAAGSGVVYPSQSVISLGTSGVYFSPIENFSSNTDEAVHSFCHCVPNTWHHMSVMLSATNCLDWICTITSSDIGTALKLAEEFCTNDLTENNAPYFLPYLSGERTPHNSADIRAAFHQINTSTSKAAILYSVLEGVTFGIKDGFKAVEAINKNTDETYIVGGGSRSDFWANLVGSAINKSIIIGEDSNLGPSLGAARLAMMATKNFASKDVFKKMPIRKETSVDKKLSEMLSKRYAIWSEIVSTNLTIAGKLKI